MKKPPETGPENFNGIMRVMLAWPDEKKGPFVLEARWVNEGGRPVCVGLEIYKGVVPEPDRVSFRRLNRSASLEGIKGTDLREIPLATVIERLWEMQQERAVALDQYYRGVAQERVTDEELPREIREGWKELLALEPDEFYRRELRRQKSEDHDHFKAVARVYEAALLKPGRQRPTTAVKEHFSVSYSTATKWVGRARDLGFLPATTPGKPAGTKAATRRKR